MTALEQRFAHLRDFEQVIDEATQQIAEHTRAAQQPIVVTVTQPESQQQPMVQAQPPSRPKESVWGSQDDQQRANDDN